MRNILGIVFLLIVGTAFLIPGIVGTAITSKIHHSPKVLRTLSIISLILGIVLCAIPFLIACFISLSRLFAA